MITAINTIRPVCAKKLDWRIVIPSLFFATIILQLCGARNHKRVIAEGPKGIQGI